MAMNACSGVCTLLVLLTLVCMVLMEQTQGPTHHRDGEHHHPGHHPVVDEQHGGGEEVVSAFGNVVGRRSGTAVLALPEEGSSPGRPRAASTSVCAAPWGSWLDHTQTPSQRRDMWDACPANRIVRANGSMPFEQFLEDVAAALNHAVINERPILHLLAHFDAMWQIHGALRSGFWAEFGVWKGNTLIKASQQLLKPTTPTVAADAAPSAAVMPMNAKPRIFDGVIAGFDSFSGLPTFWRPGFNAGNFAKKGVDLFHYVRRKVPPEVELYKGWFQTTIGTFLEKHPRQPATFIHHDGDLFVSTAITLSLMARRIVPGTVMCFDELYGYPSYEQHEILAMFLWMLEYDVTMCALSTMAKVDTKGVEVTADAQSACFQVLTLRGAATNPSSGGGD